MTIEEMHVTFRELAQQMGMQTVRAILPENIDICFGCFIDSIGIVEIFSGGTKAKKKHKKISTLCWIILKYCLHIILAKSKMMLLRYMIREKFSRTALLLIIQGICVHCLKLKIKRIASNF
jgi:hypothetical protein